MRKSETHKDLLYNIAQKFIFERGIGNWNMDDLAKDAGITKRTLYKIIDSKEKLIEEILIGFIKGTHEEINRIINNEDDYFAAAYAIMKKFPELINRMNSHFIRDIYLQYPEMENVVNARRNELSAGVISFIDKGIRNGYLRKDLNPEFILQLFLAQVTYFIKYSGSEVVFADQLTQAFDALLKGIREQN